MISQLTISVIVENHSIDQGLESEHGLAIHLQSEQFGLLFDTGQSELLLRNAGRMNIDLTTVPWVMLSHGHYDHGGGLPALIRAGYTGKMLTHFGSFADKYIKRNKYNSPGGIKLTPYYIESMNVDLETNREPYQFTPGVLATGEIPRFFDFESQSSKFLIKNNQGQISADHLLDDQALIVLTKKGPVLICGCAHSGICNTIKYAASLINRNYFYMVLGGFHLKNESELRIKKTIDIFRQYKIEKIGLAHCTGEVAEEMFRQAFGRRCFSCPAGTIITL